MEILVDVWKIGFIGILGFAGSVGLLALISPRAFMAASVIGNRVLSFGAQTDAEQRRIDIDHFVMKHSRQFGLLVSAAVIYLWLIAHHGPEAHSKSFLLIIVAISLIMGIGALFQMISQKRTIAEHLAEANTDPLTGVANRRAFDIELSRRLAQRQRQGTALCLMIIDIDRFKTVNDEFGHLCGDAMLKRIATLLNATAREMDIVARLGGDEFAVLLPGSDLQEASQAAERMRTAVGGTPFCFDSHEHTLTVSIGVAEAERDDDAISLIRRSDSALYAAKDAGRNCSYRQGGPEPAVPVM